jgi:hypothetical protein
MMMLKQPRQDIRILTNRTANSISTQLQKCTSECSLTTLIESLRPTILLDSLGPTDPCPLQESSGIELLA